MEIQAIQTANTDVIPAPAEISEMDLEAVSGGITPVALATGWVWAGAVGVAAGAAAAVIELVNHIEEKQLQAM